MSDNWCVCGKVCVAGYPPLLGSVYFWACISHGNQSLLFQGMGTWVGAHCCSNCFNIGCNCSSGIWKFLHVFILSFIFPVPTLPKRWPSQTSISTCVGAQDTFASTPQGPSSSKGLWIPTPATVFQQTDTIAVSKGYWVPDGWEFWIAKTGLRYYHVSVGCKNRQQMLGITGVMK